MGEKAKKIGEIGENIVGNFFKLIGWSNSLPGQELTCLKPQKHANPTSKTGKKNTHGIDYLWNYKSSSENYTAESILVSVKHSDAPYPTAPKTKFKEHLKDLAHTLECYNKSELKQKQLSTYFGVRRQKDIGVLFWLSSNEDTYHDVVSKLDNFRLESDFSFDSIHLVDNQQIEFIFDAITFLSKSKYANNREILFYYPETSLNYEDKSITRSGSFLPAEFITSPIILLLLRSESNPDIFCIATVENFDEESFIMLIQAAREYTKEMKCQYLFLFPNYVASNSEHKDTIIKAKQHFDENLSSQIFVESYKPDFRSLNNEK